MALDALVELPAHFAKAWPAQMQSGQTPLQEFDTLGIRDQSVPPLKSRSRAEFFPDRLMQNPNLLASMIMVGNSSTNIIDRCRSLSDVYPLNRIRRTFLDGMLYAHF
jgi:hypothetical protein